MVQGSASEDVERPSVNRAAEGGAAFSWFTVCQSYNNSIAGDDWDLAGRLVNNVGAISLGVWLSSLGSIHKLAPQVDGRDGRYCVAFSTAATSIGKNLDAVGTALHCECLDWAHGDAVPSVAGNLPAELLVSNTFRILEPTGIAHNGNTRSHWAIAWRSSSTSPAAYVARVGYSGKLVQSPDLVASSGSATVGWPSVFHHDRYLVTGVICETFNTTVSLIGRRFDFAMPGITDFSGVTCSSAFVTWNGPAQHGAEDQRIGSGLTYLRTYAAPANSLHLMLVAVGTVNVPVAHPIIATGCSLLVPLSGPDYLGMMPLAVGNDVSWPLPLPEFLSETTLRFQDWILDPATDLLVSTRRLSVPVVK